MCPEEFTGHLPVNCTSYAALPCLFYLSSRTVWPDGGQTVHGNSPCADDRGASRVARSLVTEFHGCHLGHARSHFDIRCVGSYPRWRILRSHLDRARPES